MPDRTIANGAISPDAINRAADILAAADYAVALTGAGLSVESGIPAFRGPGGLWTRYGPPANLSYSQFLRSPQDWWERRLQDETTPGNPTYDLKDAVDRAVPNAGHRALAELEAAGIIQTTITQNVDDLHGQAGARSLLEIHGNRNRLRCIRCGRRQNRTDCPITDLNLPPICADCGGVIKLDTVMFGEPIPADTLDACFAETARCDVMLLVGTSGTVNPAAQLPRLAQQRGAQIIEVNPEPTGLTPFADIVLTGPAGATLPPLAAAIASRRRRQGQHPAE